MFNILAYCDPEYTKRANADFSHTDALEKYAKRANAYFLHADAPEFCDEDSGNYFRTAVVSNATNSAAEQARDSCSTTSPISGCMSINGIDDGENERSTCRRICKHDT